MNIQRSVARDAVAISKGLDFVKNEISFYETVSKKTKSVKKRLERLYTAQEHLINSPKESKSLVDQLKEINRI